MSDKDKYYAVMAQQTKIINAQGHTVQVVRYLVPDAEPIKVNNHIKMFGFQNPIMQQYQIFEHKSGMMIGQGRTKELAKKDVERFLRECNEDMFFKQAEVMGAALSKPEITYEEAMQSFVELLKQRVSLVKAN